MYGCNKERAHNEKTDCSCHGSGIGVGHFMLCLQGMDTGIDIFRPTDNRREVDDFLRQR